MIRIRSYLKDFHVISQIFTEFVSVDIICVICAICGILSLWDRVVAAVLRVWMTSTDAFGAEPDPLQHSVLFHGLDGVLRACRDEPALVEREQGREEHLIRPDHYDDDGPHAVPLTAAASRPSSWPTGRSTS